MQFKKKAKAVDLLYQPFSNSGEHDPPYRRLYRLKSNYRGDPIWRYSELSLIWTLIRAL